MWRVGIRRLLPGPVRRLTHRCIGHPGWPYRGNFDVPEKSIGAYAPVRVLK